MDAASELAGTAKGKAAEKAGTSTEAEMDIKLPGGGTLGAGGAKAKDAPAGVVVRSGRGPSPRP